MEEIDLGRADGWQGDTNDDGGVDKGRENMAHPMSEVNKLLRRRLRQLRRSREMTQQDLAEAVTAAGGPKLHPTTINRMERSIRKITAEELYFFSVALEMPVNYFYNLTLSGSPSPQKEQTNGLPPAHFFTHYPRTPKEA